MARLPARLRRLWRYGKAVHTVGAGLVSPLTSRLSHAVPTGVALTHEQAVAAGGQLEVAHAAETHVRALPEGEPAGHWRFAAHRHVSIPRACVLELPRARVLGPHGAVVTAGGDLVWPVSTYFGTSRPSRHPLYLQPRRPLVHHVPGRLAVLTTRGDGNYYHFLHDVLPRLAVLAACPGMAPPDRYLVPAATPWQRELLERAGVGLDRVLDSTTHPHVRADVLVVPDLPSPDLRTPSWLVPFLRERLLPAPAATRLPGRIYVTRGRAEHTRRVVNEDDVLAALRPRGFEVVDPGQLTVAEQVAVFAAAEVVVAPHGAALTNLVAMSPGSQVVELFPPDYVNTCYWELASSVPGLRYRYLIGSDDVGPRRERAMAGVSSDLTVDVAALERLLA